MFFFVNCQTPTGQCSMQCSRLFSKYHNHSWLSHHPHTLLKLRNKLHKLRSYTGGVLDEAWCQPVLEGGLTRCPSRREQAACRHSPPMLTELVWYRRVMFSPTLDVSRDNLCLALDGQRKSNIFEVLEFANLVCKAYAGMRAREGQIPARTPCSEHIESNLSM